ncbi:MAG: SMC-Scp complex subunit ScpB [Gemmataceae bacterium]|nr:SMC-Scp complex subunit ScpB [Gemmataceae bacterium]
MDATPTPPAAPALGGDWELDAFPEPVEPGTEDPAPGPTEQPTRRADRPSSIPGSGFRVPGSDEVPSSDQIVEALLFVGGPPLTAEAACAAVRGLTPDAFREAVDGLSAKYRRQARPYAVEARAGGFVLAPLPAYRGVRERLVGGPREARLSQPALDVLAVVAYRQPVGKAEVDAARGTDSGGVLRQLVRLGLVAVARRAEAAGREVRYGTTPRFLRVFGLPSLDDLPRLGDTEGTTGKS